MRRTIGWMVLSGLCIAAFCFAEPVEHQLSLSVKHSTERDEQREASDREGVNANTITTTVITRTEACTLEIAVDNEAEQSDTCELTVGFVGKSVETDKPVFLGASKKKMTVEAGETLNERFTKQFVETERTVDRGQNSNRIRKGENYEGYIVLLKAGGEIIAQESNSSLYLKDDWIAKCEAGMPAPKPGNKKKR